MQTHLQSKFDIMVTLKSECSDGFFVPRFGKRGPLDQEFVDMPTEVPVFLSPSSEELTGSGCTIIILARLPHVRKGAYLLPIIGTSIPYRPSPP